MKLFLYAVLCAAAALLAVCAGDAFALTLSGTVLDEQKVPIAGVSVTIPALHRSVVTDEGGRFAFSGLKAGIYKVNIASLGRATETRTVHLSPGDGTLQVLLRVTPLELPGLTVTARPQPTDALTSPLSVTVVEGRQLDRQRGQGVMKTIENNPGVATYTTGAGVAKPVIRGFTSQRVLVITDGVRQEGQQWGDEHGPEIDGLDVDRIEVVRGPNSVLYGSDALGGVVNVVKADLPTASGDRAEFGGTVLFNGFSNNRGRAGALSLHGAGRRVGFRANLSGEKATNVTTPARRLYNSGMAGLNGSGVVGVRGDWGSLAVDFAHFGQKLQIHEDPAEAPDATPYQEVAHDRAHLHADLHLPGLRLEADGSWQRNDRKEFEEKDAPGPVLNLALNTASLDVKGHHQPVGPMFGTVGISVMNQRNRTLAEEPLIPAFDLLNLAGFVYEEIGLKSVTISTGFRFDARSVDVKANPDLGVAAQTRDDSAVTGTAGLVYRAAGPLAFAFNVGRGWRAPTAFELFADGVHEGTVRYEVGDASMKPEVSLNFDMAVRFASHRVQGELSLFQNRISRYIHLSPTGGRDPDSGFDIFENRQADATLVGAEFSVQAQAAKWLVLNAGADFVRGTNDLTDRPLPLIPAHRLKLGARLIRASMGGVKNPYLSVNARVVDAQDRVEVFETPTEGYRLLDVGVGGEVPVGGRRASIDLAVENLFDRAYVDHLSRYKEYALNPGRNVTLKVSVPFGGRR